VVMLQLLLQLCLILLAAQLCGRLAAYIGQPRVVGEMIAGVLLGPSLFGLWLPELQQAIFTTETRPILYGLAQIGVGLYMFLVGLEFDGSYFRRQARSAIAVSVAGMLVPFIVAALLCVWLLPQPGLFADGVSYGNAALFLGAAIAITAFPMLARIIYERGLSGSALGTLALAAGAIDDAAAWCVLALVLANLSGSYWIAIKAVMGAALYAGVMLRFGRAWLAPLAAKMPTDGRLPLPLLALVLILWAISASAMEWVGLHAVFGGFLLGVVMPRGRLNIALQQRLTRPVVLLLLPMFFTYSGLKTELNVLMSWPMLTVTLVVLLASIVAKGVACWAAARLTGVDQPTALALGALMNARGLMELIIINIALQHGLIQQGLFSVLVVMAIVTTLMATPLFQLLYRPARMA